jgi:hypothetical protein
MRKGYLECKLIAHKAIQSTSVGPSNTDEILEVNNGRHDGAELPTRPHEEESRILRAARDAVTGLIIDVRWEAHIAEPISL